MPKNKIFFYLKDINQLIEKASNAGGTELGILITPSSSPKKKPTIQVSYLNGSAKAVEGSSEEFTDSIEGCPYPPRC